MLENLCGNEYQKARALMATLFNAALLSYAEDDGLTTGGKARFAIDCADSLLDELGIPDPDKVV